MDHAAVPSPLHAQAFFWTVDSAAKDIKDSLKVKCCDVHPELPYVLSANKYGHFQLWDFFKHNLLMNTTLSDVLLAVDQRKGAVSAEDMTRRLKEAGQVVSVRFVDKFALCWTTGKPPPENGSNSFNNSTRIMILCEGCLLFYDYATGVAHMLTQTELSRAPTAAEFIAPNLCAVGCADGQVRIWDCLSWSACKALTGHVKGNIIWLKLLCAKSYNPSVSETIRSSMDGGSAWASADLSVGSMLSTGPATKEEKPRLLSVGQDGGALLWDLIISAGTVSVLGGSPAGHLLSPGCFAQHLDEASDTLYTVQGDRSVRLWDLGNIGKGSGGAVKTARRRSSFLGGSSGSEAGKISCVGKAKPRSDLSAPISKFSSCTALEHPRFPTGTFAVCAKNNAVGVVQVYESFGDDDGMSERSSVTASDSAAMRYHELHLFKMTTVLTALLIQAHQANPDVQISPAVVGACRDSNNLKVYSLQAHLLYPQVLVACTSVGIVALAICAPGTPCGEGPRVGTHPLWGSHVMTYTDHSIRYCSLRVAKPSSSGQGAPRPKSMRRRHNSSNSIGGSTDIAQATTDDGVVLDVVAELQPSAASLTQGGAAGMPVGLDTSTRGRASSVAAQTLKLCNLAVISSRPVFYPSCSGLFCAAFWPESQIYVVFKVGPSGIGAVAESVATSTPSRRSFNRGGSNTFRGGERMVDIERGMCYSLGWCATCVDSEDVEGGAGSADVLCLITPPKKISGPKKRQSIIDNVFSSKKKEAAAVIPSELVLKQVHADLRVTHVLPDGAPNGVTTVLGGGPYLCLSTPITAHLGDGKKAVSQIELEAQAEERARHRTASTASLERTGEEEDTAYTALAPEGVILKSQFYRAVFGVSAKRKLKADEAAAKAKAAAEGEETAAAVLPAPELYLLPVGPVFQHIKSVAWDLTCGRAAIMMAATNRITVLAFGTTVDEDVGGDCSLSVAGSVQLSEGAVRPPFQCSAQHMHWFNGSIFVTSPSTVHVVFAVGSGNATRLKAFPVASLHQSLCEPMRAKSYFGSGLPMKPFGWLENVALSSGCLILSAPGSVMTAVPLTWSPVVALGILGSSLLSAATEAGVAAVLPWVQAVPTALRPEIVPLLEGLMGTMKLGGAFGVTSVEELLGVVRGATGSTNIPAVLDGFLLGDTQSGCVGKIGNGMSYLDSILLLIARSLKEKDDEGTEEELYASLQILASNVVADCSIRQANRLSFAVVSSTLESKGEAKAENEALLSIVLRNMWLDFGDKTIQTKSAPQAQDLLDSLQTSELRISKYKVVA